MAEKVVFLLRESFEVLSQQHEKSMQRLSLQEDLLKQVLRCCTSMDAEISGGPFVDSPFGSESVEFPQVSGEDLTDVRLKSPLQSPSGNGSVSGAPSIFNSYTKHDLDLKEDAQKVHSRMSVYQSERLTVPRKPCVQGIVNHPAFDAFFAFVVVTNSIFIGFDVQRSIEDPSTPLSIKLAQYFYTVLFATELGMRVAAGGCRFFISEDWMWALIDSVIVAGALLDVALACKSFCISMRIELVK